MQLETTNEELALDSINPKTPNLAVIYYIRKHGFYDAVNIAKKLRDVTEYKNNDLYNYYKHVVKSMEAHSSKLLDVEKHIKRLSNVA